MSNEGKNASSSRTSTEDYSQESFRLTATNFLIKVLRLLRNCKVARDKMFAVHTPIKLKAK